MVTVGTIAAVVWGTGVPGPAAVRSLDTPAASKARQLMVELEPVLKRDAAIVESTES